MTSSDEKGLFFQSFHQYFRATKSDKSKEKSLFHHWSHDSQNLKKKLFSFQITLTYLEYFLNISQNTSK